jgi:hypothetical protein
MLVMMELTAIYLGFLRFNQTRQPPDESSERKRVE